MKDNISPAQALLWANAIFKAISSRQSLDPAAYQAQWFDACQLAEAGAYLVDQAWLELDKKAQEERNARDAYEFELRREREKVTA